jgi:hypothetical protein
VFRTLRKHKKNAQREHNPSTTATTTPPDLLSVMTAWDKLPEAVRLGILAMVKAARGE